MKKLAQCSTVFDFMDPMSDLRGKEIKRATLNELVDYITSERGVLTDAAYPEVVAMVNGIIFVPSSNAVLVLRPFRNTFRACHLVWRPQSLPSCL